MARQEQGKAEFH
uniref:Uncharacterized protein n=1 Tax=Arundo donax TaxID=35708 RepID=A0A0A9HQE7_ARUDO